MSLRVGAGLLALAPFCASGATIVTPEVLLEYVGQLRSEVAALPELSWTDNDRRVVISMAGGFAAPTGEPMPEYVIASVEVKSGRVTIIGEGYGPVAAARGDTVAYFERRSRGQRVSLRRANGEALCSIEARDLMPEARSIQAIAVSADGKKIALAAALGPDASDDDDEAVNSARSAEVRVFDTRQNSTERSGVALWITDQHCRKPRRVAQVPDFRIGRLTWADHDLRIVAAAATPPPGGGFPRTDLLLFDLAAGSWSTLISNVGGQASWVDGVLQASPDGSHVTFTYDQDGLPYLLRKQFAVASIAEGRIRTVSANPRESGGWLNAHTLWITRLAPHPLLARSAVLTLDGAEHDVDVPGNAVPSLDGNSLGWLQNDLYGNSELTVARVVARNSRFVVRDMRVIWRGESELARYARGKRRFVHCQSSDSVRPAAILTLPLDHDPQQRYPLIVDIHGGPRGSLESARFSYMPGAIVNRGTLEHDLWAAKGYAVLAPDYRGSGTYGFDKVSRDGTGYERDMQDILCNVDKIVEEGVVDPDRMAVVGHSYGGAQVNWIVTHTHRFSAAVSAEGSFNVHYGVGWGSRGIANQQHTLMYGSPLEFPDHYRRMSVMDSVRGVTTPTLFVQHHGGNRPGDLYSWMFTAWRAQGVEAQLRLYEQKAHVLTRPADQADLLHASIRWIDDHLSRAGTRLPVSGTHDKALN